MAGPRIVIISNKGKLDYTFGRLVFRDSLDGKLEILLDEIGVLIIENIGVSLTAYLLNELNNRNIKVIFCNLSHNPAFEITNLYGSYDSSKKIDNQIKWDIKNKDKVWQKIISLKITAQHELVSHINDLDRSKTLLGYLKKIEEGDKTNREGMASRLNFNALFGTDFNREQEICLTNSILDYGYTIFNSVFNREVCANGYLTQIGICHRGESNPFNLSSDLMEPFRSVVDRYAYNKQNKTDNVSEDTKLTTEIKYEIVNLLNEYMMFNGKRFRVSNVISMYTKIVLDTLTEKDFTKLNGLDISFIIKDEV